MRIALLGTGLMGYAMAERLLEQGADLSVWNRTRAKAEPLGEQGARVEDSAIGAIESAGVGGLVLAMLRDASAIRSALDGALPALSGKTFVQMSTIAPGESRALAAEIEAAGGAYLEAPVLGSTPQARGGTLQVLVGGDPELFSRFKETLALLGPPTLVGPVGQGAALKLALNQLIPNLIAAFSLSLGLVRRSGVDLDLFLGILRKSALYAPSFDGKLPKIRIRDFSEPSFPAELMLKDLDLIRAECETLGLDATVADAVRDVLVRTVEGGQGGADYSALYEVIDPRD
ncbi:MAG TPA: NAD(P)-dependent oxidoreductase [Thermoanaerobaculia bacterium]|jgi:3-hydroxyisobutyrate dehydrogenase-like beta-hydroxyacid dehydrogenase|nr:NAD(P)-dependent oxidoreductase [Thermoanaerobaculia bacterium]